MKMTLRQSALTLLIISTLFLHANTGCAQEPPFIEKAAALKIAKDYAVSLDPPINLELKREFGAVLIKNEKVWVVSFVDKRPIPPPDSDFMVKIDAETGKPLAVLGGADKAKYYSYLTA